MNPLKIGISGVRGIVGETFTPHLVVEFTSAFATYAGGGTVYVCEDARPSGRMVSSAVISSLIACGCAPVDLGVCPVPRMQYMISRSPEAAGGIAISAGHNSEDWNALRFIRPDGLYFNALQAEELLDVYHQGEFVKAGWDELELLSAGDGCRSGHLEAILSAVDAGAIRRAKFNIAADTCNGACSYAAAELLDELGCRTAILNDEPHEPFPYDPEPGTAGMGQLKTVVEATGFDAGFMFDTAGERLALVTDRAEPMNEEFTISLCTALKLERRRGIVVTNVSTTRALEDLAAKKKSTVLRTPVGMAFVSEAAARQGAVIAGEGSGGVIIPEVQWTGDALATMAFILDGLARKGERLSVLADSLPSYVMKKKRIPLDYTSIYRVIRKVRSQAKKLGGAAVLDLSDGIKVEWKSSWLHVRPSNTESLIRVIAEARSGRRADELLEMAAEWVSG